MFDSIVNTSRHVTTQGEKENSIIVMMFKIHISVESEEVSETSFCNE